MGSLLSRSSLLCGILLTLYSVDSFGIAASRNFESKLPNSAAPTWTLVSLGDSIGAGYCGINCTQNAYTQFMTYLNAKSTQSEMHVQIDGRIRATSGYTVGNIFDDLDNHADDLKAADIVTLEACGNDYLNGRSEFRNKKKAGYCDPNRIARALKDCKAGIAKTLDKIVHMTQSTARIRVMNIYYPGIDDDASKNCKTQSHFKIFLPNIVEGNWYTCDYARQLGIPCVDAFAEFNSADIDTNGDGIKDHDQIAWVPGEPLDSYKTRLTKTYVSLLSDANRKINAKGEKVGLLIGDNTHPNQEGHSRLGALHHALGY